MDSKLLKSAVGRSAR